MNLFTNHEIGDLLHASQIGLWKVEFREGEAPRFFADDAMDELLGIDPAVSPEERSVLHHMNIHPDDLMMFQQYSDKLMSERAEVVYRYIHPTKGEMYVRCGGMRDFSNTDCICLVGTHQDISDTIRLEQNRITELRLQEENLELKRIKAYSDQFYSRLVRLQPCGTIAYRVPSHEILIMNDMARRMYELTPSDPIDKAIELIQEGRIIYDNEQETKRKIASLEKHGDHTSFTMHILHRDGKSIHVFANTQLIEMANGDRIIMSSLQDISEITKLTEYNRQLAEQLDIIRALASTYNALYYIDMQNGSFIELGLQLDGVRPIIGSRGDAQKSLDAMCDHFIVSEKEKVWEFTRLSTLNERLKGRLFVSQQFLGNVCGWAEGMFIAAERDKEGNCKHVIWATHSIDETKQKELAYQEALEKATEEAQSANAAKTSFLFNMSHDIRTPMNAILGFTQLMKNQLEHPAVLEEYLTNVEESGEYLLSIINNVLDMARIESGKVDLDLALTDLGDKNRMIMDMFTSLLGRKNLTLHSSTNITHRYVIADASKLTQVLANLLSNAIKYTPEGGVITLEMEEKPSEKPGYATYVTTVSDNGIGMSKEFQTQIFDSFSRERTTTESKIMGTGLGMAIVKNFVDLMGGTIQMESTLGKGTVFRVTFLFELAEEKAGDEKQSAANTEPELNLRGKRILLAEDNEINALIAVAILNDFGIDVDVADDGLVCLEMLEKAEDGYYDLILMDIQMPNMDGYEATKRIRRMEDQKKAGLPIVALTANAFEEDRHNALSAGMNDHLAKPIEIPLLQETLTKLLL